MSTNESLLRPLYRLYEDRLVRDLDTEALPKHIGVIHDGHRRYARASGLPDYQASYRAGMAKFEEFLERLREAKDKSEFDQFMDERARAARNDGTADA